MKHIEYEKCDGKIEKKFNVSAEPDIHYHVEETEKNNCKIKECKYYNEKMKLNCSYSDDNSICYHMDNGDTEANE